jgi:hypothetical protein
MRDRAPGWLVVVGLFAAPTAWSLQLLVAYLVNGDQCGVPLLSPDGNAAGPSIVVVGAGVLALVVCLGGLWAAFRTWRLTRNEGPGDRDAALTAGVGRTRFLGLCGLVAGGIFLAATGFALLVPFLVTSCAA